MLVSVGDAVPVAPAVVPGPVLVVEPFVLETLLDPVLVVILRPVVVEKVFGSVAATLVAGRVWVSFWVLSEVLRTLVTTWLPELLTVSLSEKTGGSSAHHARSGSYSKLL